MWKNQQQTFKTIGSNPQIQILEPKMAICKIQSFNIQGVSKNVFTKNIGGSRTL